MSQSSEQMDTRSRAKLLKEKNDTEEREANERRTARRVSDDPEDREAQRLEDEAAAEVDRVAEAQMRLPRHKSSKMQREGTLVPLSESTRNDEMVRTGKTKRGDRTKKAVEEPQLSEPPSEESVMSSDGKRSESIVSARAMSSYGSESTVVARPTGGKMIAAGNEKQGTSSSVMGPDGSGDGRVNEEMGSGTRTGLGIPERGPAEENHEMKQRKKSPIKAANGVGNVVAGWNTS